MAIFMPSQVTPDVRSGLGAGTADANDGLTVSWHVNGPSAMTQFQIRIFRNDATSALLYDTGIRTDGCPVFGTDSTGEALFFSYKIEKANLLNAMVINGGEYKLVITQWWSPYESVTQASASVFRLREKPVLSVSPIGTGGVIDARTYTFTGEYSQADGDVLNWFRWRIAQAADGAYVTLLDTGDVSGTMDISCRYDGFFAGSAYAVRLNVQTENGVEADTGWVDFSVEYDTIDLQNQVTATCTVGTDAVSVEWSDVDIIPGNMEGDGISFRDGDDPPVFLPDGTQISWNTVGTKPMSFDAPWSVVWKGTLDYADADCFAVAMEDGSTIKLLYGISAHTLTLTRTTAENVTTTLATQTGVINTPTVTAVLTPDTLYLRAEYLTGGLYPSEGLYPSDGLYPREDTIETVDIYTISVSYTQEAVSRVSVGGVQQCWYIEVINGAASADVISHAITVGDYVPGSYDEVYMLAGWMNGSIDAGKIQIPDTVVGWSVYRRQGDNGFFVHVGDTDFPTGMIYDYGAASQQGPYSYLVFPLGEKSYITTGIQSNQIAPCWWNWTLMECAETGDADIFIVLRAYRFRLNIVTGSVSNNNAPSILNNFTRYPTVQLAPQNYKSGSLTSLIGVIDWSGGQPEYMDSVSLMEEIMGLSVTRNPLFLKSRKGELTRVRISGPVAMQTADATREQMQTATIPWAETGSAKNVGLYSTVWVAAQEQEGGHSEPQYVVDTADGTATKDDIKLGIVAYSRGSRLVGTIPDGNEVAF